MAATGMSQWLFPVSAIVEATPSRTTSSISVEKELYDRARGVEFLFRLGVTLGLYVLSWTTCMTPRNLDVQSIGHHLRCTRLRHGSIASTCAVPWRTTIGR